MFLGNKKNIVSNQIYIAKSTEINQSCTDLNEFLMRNYLIAYNSIRNWIEKKIR